MQNHQLNHSNMTKKNRINIIRVLSLFSFITLIHVLDPIVENYLKEKYIENEIGMEFKGVIITSKIEYNNHGMTSLEIEDNNIIFKFTPDSWINLRQELIIGDSIFKKKDTTYIILKNKDGESKKYEYSF